MRVIYGLNQIKRFRKPVVALGVFDGVHVAHRRILKETVKKAKTIKGTSTVITFWPHPQQEKNLYSLGHRLKLIAGLNIDICIVIKFSYAFSQISAEDFIRNILVKRIGAKHVYVGENFRFGRQGNGNFRTLKKLSSNYNFKLKVFSLIKANKRSISSTYIRHLISVGKLDTARKLLTRPVSILGTVIKGTSLAAKLGFPTANINLHHEVLPPSGVYAVLVFLNHRRFKGVCNIGSKPTFQKTIDKHIEVHIFGFRQNIYGKDLEIQFIKKLRDERKFSSPQSLVQQVKKDIESGKRQFPLPFTHHNR